MAGTLETGEGALPPLPSGFTTVFFEGFNEKSTNTNSNDTYNHGLDRWKWQTIYGGSEGTNDNYDYRHDQVNVDAGDSNMVRVAATHDNTPGTLGYNKNLPSSDWNPDWMAGGFSTAKGWASNTNQYAWQNGRFEFRARVDGVDANQDWAKGTGPAVLLWPNEGGWPPEIDLLESPAPDRMGMYFSVHWKDGNGAHQQANYHFDKVNAADWHVYRLDWNGSNMSFWVDGVKMKDHFGGDPRTKMAFGMQMFVADNDPNNWYGGPPDEASIRNGHDGIGLEVDWVRVAQSNGTATPPPPPPSGPTTGNDNLTGTDSADTIDLLAGNDIYNGMGGDDIIKGNTGKDTMTGGAGNDIFDFDLVSHSPSGSGRDIIKDFNAGTSSTVVDRIDLNSIDANTGVSGDQNFTLIGASNFDSAGQVRIDNKNSGYTLVEINTDSDKASEMQIELNKISSGNITSADFIL